MNLKSISFYLSICLLLINFSSYNQVTAQTDSTDKKWHYLSDVYLMFVNINGETGVGENLLVPIDADPGDIFSKLKVGAMLYLEAHTDKWAITSDFVFMNLNQEITPGKVFHEGDVTAKQLIWEAAGLYRIAPFIEVGAGARLNILQTEIEARRNVFPAGTEEVSGSHNATWIDPILITRLSADINDKWLFQFRGDIGGFGIGSDLTWQLQAYAGYRFTKVFQITAGYRVLSIDYDKPANTEEFIFNTKEFGPNIRLGFNF
jgi:hypothetical protein